MEYQAESSTGARGGAASDGIRSALHRQAEGTGGWLLLIALAALVFALDQGTKTMVARNLGAMPPGYSLPVLGDFVRLVYATNTGAAFSLFTDRTVILTVIAFAAVPLLLFGHRYLPVTGWGARICIGLLLGGTLGNLADRVQHGFVIDFVSAGFGSLRWPTFNVADSAFVVGVLLMALLALVAPPGPRSGQNAR